MIRTKAVEVPAPTLWNSAKTGNWEGAYVCLVTMMSITFVASIVASYVNFYAEFTTVEHLQRVLAMTGAVTSIPLAFMPLRKSSVKIELAD